MSKRRDCGRKGHEPASWITEAQRAGPGWTPRPNGASMLIDGRYRGRAITCPICHASIATQPAGHVTKHFRTKHLKRGG